MHPAHGAPYLADGQGRFVLLRGVDENALVQYPQDYPEAPTISRADLAEMAALGFNFVRLAVSWSRIMPEPGRIDTGYLRQVARVVTWARAYGIGVLVDMHEDNYSTVTYPDHESDGAPSWAVLDGGTPCTVVASTTKCALAAFASFWADDPVAGRPLQQWYLEATAAVAKAAGAASETSNVVGVELMNEPWPAGPSPFEQRSLYPFYNRMIAGLRRAHIVVPLWFEPSIVRDVSNDAVGAAMSFSHDPDLVYAVHIYSGVFAAPYGPVVSLASLVSSYSAADEEATRFDTPFVVDEFGSTATDAWDSWLVAQLGDQNASLVGSGFWLWKQRIGAWDNWAVVHTDGSLRTGTERAQLLSEPHADAVPGRLESTAVSAGRLSVSSDGPKGTAVLWAGTRFAARGQRRPGPEVRHVTVDGRTTTASCRTASGRAGRLQLEGCLLVVAVDGGHHRIVVRP